MGIAIFDHPGNLRHPTRWHVRTYGLFAANPFGERDIGGKEGESSAYRLQQGQTLRLRYRVLLHHGDEQAGKVADAFADYAKMIE